MRVGIFTAYADRLEVSRAELIAAMLAEGNTIIAIGPEPDPKRTDSNIFYHQVEIGRANTNPLKELITLKRLAKELHALKMDILLVYGARMAASVLPVAGFAGIKRRLCVINGAGGHYYLAGARGVLVRMMSWPMMKLGLSGAKCIFFQNEDDRALYRKQHLVRLAKTKILGGSGVNMDRFPCTPLPETQSFLMLTRLASDKGIGEYIEAARQVKATYPEAEFHLVGQTDISFPEAEKQLLDAAIAQQVIHYHGGTSDPAAWYQKCRYFVCASYHEGTPRTVLEALSTGRPVLTTDAPGCRDTIVDGVSGILVPVRSVVALAEKMRYMMAHPQEMQRMADAAVKRVEEKYEVNRVNREILDEVFRKWE